MNKPRLTFSQLSKCTCPYCGTGFDIALKANDDRPVRPGTLTMCMQCGEVCVIGPGPKMELRKPSKEQLSKLNLRALQMGRQLYKAVREGEAND